MIIILWSCQNNKFKPKEDITLDSKILSRAYCCSDNVIVQVKITNNKMDTVSFWIMRCSWEWLFKTDNADIDFCMRNCNSNAPIKIILEPKDSIVFTGMLRFKKESKIKKFKIGFLIANNSDFDSDFMYLRFKSNRKIYWSNNIELGDKPYFGYELKKHKAHNNGS